MNDASEAVRKLEEGCLKQSLKEFRGLIEAARDDPRRVSNWLLARQYDDSLTHDEIAQELWAMGCLWPNRPRPLRREGAKPLRIGFVSSDFNCHTVGRLFHPLAKALSSLSDEQKPLLYGYHNGSYKDALTASLAQCLALRDIYGLSLSEAARIVQDDDLDVLVDLSGHTKGHRLALFASRLVAVQVSWLGFTDTTGLSFVDAVISDTQHVPSSLAYRFRESLIYLPTARFLFEAPEETPGLLDRDVAVLSRGEGEAIELCCYNNLAKISESTLVLWAKVLARLPKAALSLRWRSFSDEGAKSLWRARLASVGIDPKRVRLLGECSYSDLMQSYATMDIALDTYPFNGAMTSFDALWMGVPLVSRFAELPASRQGLSILNAIGLEQMAVDNDADYIDQVCKLANDTEKRIELRNQMRNRLRLSPLMNASAFAQHWLAAIRQAIDLQFEATPR